MEFKPTIKKVPSNNKASKKLEKSFSNIDLTEMDSVLTEKEHSFKKKFWDLAKMESLVHSDPILSAEFTEMSEDGQEKYGYHYNETIMNMLFNKYVTNDQGYQQKYLNAIPAKKERRDKSGINQLQQKGEEKMDNKKASLNKENAVPIHNNSLEGVIEEMDNNLNTNGGGTFDDREYLNQRIEKKYDTMEEPIKKDVEETTGAASSGAFTPALDAKNNVYESEDCGCDDCEDCEEKIDETTDSGSSGAFVGPFHKKGKDHVTNKPAWDGGEMIGESYLTNGEFFKNIYEGLNSPNNDSRVPMAEFDMMNDKQMLQSNLNAAMLGMKNLANNKSPEAERAYNQHKQVAQNISKQLGKPFKEPKQGGFMSGIKRSLGIGEGDEMNVHSTDAKLNSKQDKINYILDNGKNKFGDADMLNHMDDSSIDNILNKVNSNKVALDPSANKFMEGEVSEDDNAQYQRKFFSYNEALELASILDNAPVEQEDKILKDFAEKRDLSIKELKNQVNMHIQSKLQGSDSPEFFKMENIITVINDILDVSSKSKIDQMKSDVRHDRQNVEIDTDPMGESIISGTEGSIIGDNPTTMAGTMKDIQMGSVGGFQEGEEYNLKNHGRNDDIKIDGENSLKDFGVSREGFGGFNNQGDGDHPNYKDPSKFAAPRDNDLSKYDKMTESKDNICENCGTSLDEDGHCRKDEKPVAGKIAGEKGSCQKKKSSDNKADDNKFNVEFRRKKEKERADNIEKKHDDYKKELDQNRKHMSKLKEMVEGGETLAEDKRPSALVQMDRLHKDNSKNFKTDMKDSNTSEIKIQQDELTAKDQVEEVPENAYELGEKIEKEKKKEHDEALKNEGNSTNDNNKEIPKRNATDDEAKEIMLNRGLGMQDIAYDNKPDERFEDRMKKDMGEQIYDQRQEKMEFRAEAPMYNKDTQPVGDQEFETKYEKNIKENHIIAAKYRDKMNNLKFINFNVNEAPVISKVEGTKLILEGMGNTYTQSVNENVDMRNMMDSFDFYINSGKVSKVAKGKQALIEGEEKKPINEEFEKMKKLWNYKPEAHLSTSNVKKNRKF